MPGGWLEANRTLIRNCVRENQSEPLSRTGYPASWAQNGSPKGMLPSRCQSVPRARPFFAERAAMKVQLQRLALHPHAQWVARLRGPTGMCKQRAAFLDDYFPLTKTGKGPLRPGQRAERLPQGAAAPPSRPRQYCCGAFQSVAFGKAGVAWGPGIGRKLPPMHRSILHTTSD